MAEIPSPDLDSKGKRVAGVFAFMVGASIILDTHAFWIGVPILAVGVALFVWGMLAAREPLAFAAPARDVTSETQQ